MDIMCNSPFQRNGDSKLFNLPKKFRWDDVKKHEFVKTINSIEFRSKLMALSCDTGHLSCNTAVEELTRLVKKVADRTIYEGYPCVRKWSPCRALSDKVMVTTV